MYSTDQKRPQAELHRTVPKSVSDANFKSEEAYRGVNNLANFGCAETGAPSFLPLTGQHLAVQIGRFPPLKRTGSASYNLRVKLTLSIAISGYGP